MSKNAICAAAVVICGLAASANAAPKGPVAMIRQTMDSFNRGDMAAFKAAHVASPSIIDEPPPHAWSGPGAVDAWFKDLQADSAKRGDTDGKIVLGRPTEVLVDGDAAYVVIRVTYTYTEKGKSMAEPGSFTMALHKARKGWQFTAWAFSGGTPRAAPAAKPMAAATPMAKPATPKH